MEIKIYNNPKILLENAGAGWVWEITFLIILIGLTISFVSEIFKIQKKQNPDFWGVVWKTSIIIILYKFLPETVEQIVKYISGTVSSKVLDEEFYKAFTKINLSLSRVYSDQEVSPGCPAHQNITLVNAEIDYIRVYFFQYFLKVIIFYFLLAIWVVKEIVFSWMWPVFMSLNMIGLCSALAVPAFPGQGFGSIGSFFKSLATIALWPVIYSVFLFICSAPLAEVFKITERSLACPTIYEAGTDTVTTISGSLFMLFMIGAIPFISKKLIDHEGLKSVAFSGMSGTGSLLVYSGTRIISGSSDRSMISQIGTQMIKSGSSLSEYAKNNNIISEYKEITAKYKENEKKQTQTNQNIIKDLISSENTQHK